MATPTGTLAMEVMKRMRRDIDKAFFFDTFTTTTADSTNGMGQPKPLTPDVIRGWIKDVSKIAHDYIEPITFTVLDKQQQRRTPITGYYHVRSNKQRTKTRKQGRKCSRRKWKAMNRRQSHAEPIYAEPTDVLVINGKSIVTPAQYQALKAATVSIRGS